MSDEYGIITPQFRQTTRDLNTGIFLSRRGSASAVMSCSDSLGNGVLQLVFDTTDIGKDYQRIINPLNREDNGIYNNYYKRDGRINTILAQMIYANGINRYDGDMHDDGYITDFFITFNVVDNRFFVKVGNNNLPSETVTHAPYQNFERQVREIGGLASPCLIVDLSEVV